MVSFIKTRPSRTRQAQQSHAANVQAEKDAMANKFGSERRFVELEFKEKVTTQSPGASARALARAKKRGQARIVQRTAARRGRKKTQTKTVTRKERVEFTAALGTDVPSVGIPSLRTAQRRQREGEERSVPSVGTLRQQAAGGFGSKKQRRAAKRLQQLASFERGAIRQQTKLENERRRNRAIVSKFGEDALDTFLKRKKGTTKRLREAQAGRIKATAKKAAKAKALAEARKKRDEAITVLRSRARRSRSSREQRRIGQQIFNLQSSTTVIPGTRVGSRVISIDKAMKNEARLLSQFGDKGDPVEKFLPKELQSRGFRRNTKSQRNRDIGGGAFDLSLFEF